MTRDNQRQAVYNWELSIRNKYPQPDLGLMGSMDLIEEISRHYGIQPPVVCDGRGRKIASYSRRRNRINLPRWARNPIIVCHEMAHAIDFDSRHGPAFARLLLRMWNTYANVDYIDALTIGDTQKPRRVNFV